MRQVERMIRKLDLHGINPVEAVLELTAKHTFMPDIYSRFGAEAVFGLIERFGGKALKLPSPKDLEKAFVDFQIWSDLTAHRGHNRELLIARLMRRYELTKPEINRAFDRTEAVVDDIDPMRIIFARRKKS